MEAGITRARTLVLALIVALLAAGASLAAAQTATAAPQLLAPGNGKVLARGSQPLFKARDTSPNARKYTVYMTISRSKKVDRKGDLKQTRPGTFTSMRRTGKYGFVYKPEAYSFPTWFMQAPGKYYWQAYHIDCAVRGCHVQSRIRSFVVR
ncbi:hypothetical protein [Conexibacter woesei]|uniref:YkuD domain-containing protein n=1 Tax=Conexibacter woesei (strain DSM 14684 / CCUG 47730 / CIP 108061 / JCM 11494 / NBRC 100937 / ID131577) TaxID=469383 RepID=D3F043_CONWI|nr:hypothetical protein [Conexibacter woesei]ADB50019.1 hypothetical protein Cwoe_1591 [Conexibacter woesei DSM 14684]